MLADRAGRNDESRGAHQIGTPKSYQEKPAMTTMPSASALRMFTLALLLVASGCSNMSKPGPQSVAGMSPDATVIMTEIMAAGAEGGKGTLNFQGHSYPFKLVGGVTGGGGAANTTATGQVYNLHNISDFKGLYTQSSGGPGLVTS